MERYQGPSVHRDLEGSQVRLAELHPSPSYDDPIICFLDHQELSLGPHYEALSYEWGDPSLTETIFLDDKPFPVTKKLFAALKALRRREKHNDEKGAEASIRVLWIDALCINQADIPERNSEVQRMRDIYAFASNTIFWLGDYGEESPSAVREAFAAAVAHARDKTVLPSPEATNCLARLGWRPWFRRAWVVQEVLTSMSSPQQSPLLMCGDEAVPFRPFVDLLHGLAQGNTVLALSCLPALTMRGNLDGYRQLLAQPFIKRLYAGLESSYLLLATDVRDKIYAWLGILNTHHELPPELLPDYSKPAHEVLLEYGAYILEESQDLNLLAGVGRPMEGLPSWVPTWDSFIFGCHPRDKAKPRCVEFAEGNRKLKLDGFELFEIEDTATAKTANPLGAESREMAGKVIRDLERALLKGSALDEAVLGGEDKKFELACWARMAVDIAFGCEDVGGIIDPLEAYAVLVGQKPWDHVPPDAREKLERRWEHTRTNAAGEKEEKVALAGRGLLGTVFCVYVPDRSDKPRMPRKGDAVFRIRGTPLEMLLTRAGGGGGGDGVVVGDGCDGGDNDEWEVVGLVWRSFCTGDAQSCAEDEEDEFWGTRHRDRTRKIVIR